MLSVNLLCTFTLKSIGHLALWMALLSTGNLENIPPLTHAEFPNIGISYNIKRSYSLNFTTDLITKVLWQIQIFQNSDCHLKTWIVSLAMVTDSLCSISRKCISRNTPVWRTTVCPSVVLSSKNDAPRSWVSPSTQGPFLKPVTVLRAHQQCPAEPAFLTQNSKETFARGRRFHKQ